MNYEIIRLSEEEYEYHELHYIYTSNEHYTVKKQQDKQCFSCTFTREHLTAPYIHDSYDTLYSGDFPNCEAYGLIDKYTGEIVAYLEICREEWNDRLRITNLLVKEQYRRYGLGSLLIKKAKSIAEQEDRRIIVLETQSCNVPAIDFYLSHGFVFAGTNLYFYSNVDIEEDEVMLELVYLY
ncbi:MAG: GNAT family N-acetyltransferase [Clostridia bacterium]|nr:GNAT family N-acetyltransferase [Clostridia bacterium]